eukprot:augustus_masked-scaffold_3-processed-gene-3.74-mRNA-1 protein AED:0.03 eAED:0.03 QI:0/-1/0/1/-1/1/1/0/384
MIELYGLKVSKFQCQEILKKTKSYILRRRGIKPVVKELFPDCCVILYDKEKVQDKSVIQALAGDAGELFDHRVCIGYDNMSQNEIFKTLIPGNEFYPSSFETVGHIAHLNLRDEFLPHKNIIGEVILDKNNNIRTVVNKVSKIDNVYRTFDMELLAGQENYLVKVREQDCWFEFDFRKVYFNSKLQMEHTRLTDHIVSEIKASNSTKVIWDVFCGVGPFVLPLAKKLTNSSCIIKGNDLNPESYKYLNENLNLNKIDKEKLKTYNVDAREIIEKICSGEEVADYVIMNLPDSGLEFLSYFNTFDKTVTRLPKIFCYFFWPSADEFEIQTRLEQSFSGKLAEENFFKIRKVRTVAPHKLMILAQLQVTPSLVSSSNKRQKLESPP